MFDKILIANRGEIALRVLRACKELGIATVAVHSTADAQAMHVRLADETVCIGPPPARSSYLRIPAILSAATITGADAIHPGLGFLSENADFAAAVEEHGFVFIGPSPEHIRLMGDKVRAKAEAKRLGIPTVPGSPDAVRTIAAAEAAARAIGYPVLLKASAGGGGRGMKLARNADELARMLPLAQSEAKAAFADDSVYLERYLDRPRHIEVQVLADSAGDIVHLWERDCSVQLRHQKLVEIAPAPNLKPELRIRLLEDALRLARAAKFLNAGTVEFLVDPERGEHVFIECNPRIQVEHTVTEEVTGVDLVEAQFRLAAGERLSDLGLADPPPPRGFAAQARVLATGAGVITAYKEPAGPGVRVDACGYAGLAPPPQFDPMFAKLIAKSNSTGSLPSALDRAARALDEFQIAGLPTNLAALKAILAHPAVRAGDARTSLLSEHPEVMTAAASAPSGSLALLQQQAPGVAGGPAAPAPTPSAMSLSVRDGDEAVECPMAGAIVELTAAAGTTVRAGDTLMVVSAMKMETPLTAPCDGVVTEVAPVGVGASIAAGQIVATIAPSRGGGDKSPREYGDQTWAPLLADVKALRDIAEARFAPGSTDPGVVRQRSRGKLTCRERIALLLDEGSFREVGSAAGFASYDEDGAIADFTPANHVGGWGRIDGRTAVVCADDFTSRGGHADGAIGAKSGYLDRLSIDFRCPSVRLLDGSSGGGSVAAMVPKQQAAGESHAQESSGAITAGRPRVAGGGGSFLPGHLGSSMFAEQLSQVPVVNLLLGSVVGIGAAKAVLGHFSVMVRDIAQLFVAGPPVVSHAMGYDITKEDLGDWRIHCRNGSVDNLAETEVEAVAQAKRFLSYLPSSVYEAAAVLAADPGDPIDRREEELFTIVPRKRTSTFDMRRAIRLMADNGSFFEIGPLWGTDQITGFVRFAGHPMGVIASDSRHINGGALTADGCDKLRRHLDLCDLFHLPVLNLVDNPGFAVGLEHEVAGTIRKGGEWMIEIGDTRLNSSHSIASRMPSSA